MKLSIPGLGDIRLGFLTVGTGGPQKPGCLLMRKRKGVDLDGREVMHESFALQCHLAPVIPFDPILLQDAPHSRVASSFSSQTRKLFLDFTKRATFAPVVTHCSLKHGSKHTLQSAYAVGQGEEVHSY
ncbi:hypothetical protein STEG23_021571 [Scotinomys teguina]